MAQRWIQHINGMVKRGDGTPPEGDCYLVGEAESDSAALVDGRLHKEGKRVAKGSHALTMRNGENVTFEVDVNGSAKRKGVKPSGQCK